MPASRGHDALPLVSTRAAGELVHFLLPVQGRVVTMQAASVEGGIPQASSRRSAARTGDKETSMREKRWLAHYDEGVPQTLAPYPLRTLLNYVAETVQQRPDHPAVLFKGRSVTYEALAELSNACAAALADMGVKPDDRVALLLPNCP